MGLTSLNHHLDLAWLREAYRRMRKDGAAGVDGQTAAAYEEHLEDNLRSLLERAKSGTYRAPPVDGPGTFDLLGFTYYGSRSRQGNWVVKRKTAKSRFTRAVRTIAPWCRLHRHDPIPEQHQTLCQKLHGSAGAPGEQSPGATRPNGDMPQLEGLDVRCTMGDRVLVRPPAPVFAAHYPSTEPPAKRPPPSGAVLPCVFG